MQVTRVVQKNHLKQHARFVDDLTATGTLGIRYVSIETIVCELIQLEGSCRLWLAVVHPQGTHVVNDRKVKDGDQRHRGSDVVVPELIPARYLHHLLIDVHSIET